MGEEEADPARRAALLGTRAPGLQVDAAPTEIKGKLFCPPAQEHFCQVLPGLVLRMLLGLCQDASGQSCSGNGKFLFLKG